MLKAPTNNTPRILAPEGTHIATCIGLIQIGTVKTEYLGEEKWIEKVRITFELPEELHEFKEGEDKKPLVVSQEYSHSMGSKSNLRPIVEGILGIALHDEEAYNFDLEEIIGKSCLITLAHNESKKGTKYVVIKSTAPLMKNMTKPAQINPSKILTYEKWDKDYFSSLPDFIKEAIQGSKQYKIAFGTQEKVEEISTEDIPF